MDSEEFTEGIREAVRKIRAVAPDAHIVMPGYLEVTQNNKICLVNVVQGQAWETEIDGMEKLESSIRSLQMDVAKQVDAEFIDMRTLSHEHGTCDPDKDTRMTAGIIDNAQHNIAVHPTLLGKQFQAETIGPVAVGKR